MKGAGWDGGEAEGRAISGFVWKRADVKNTDEESNGYVILKLNIHGNRMVATEGGINPWRKENKILILILHPPHTFLLYRRLMDIY